MKERENPSLTPVCFYSLGKRTEVEEEEEEEKEEEEKKRKKKRKSRKEE